MARPLLHRTPQLLRRIFHRHLHQGRRRRVQPTRGRNANAETADPIGYSDADSSAGNYHQPRHKKYVSGTVTFSCSSPGGTTNLYIDNVFVGHSSYSWKHHHIHQWQSKCRMQRVSK